MKYLLIFFIILVLVFQWRSSRSDLKRNAKVKPADTKNEMPAGPQSMIACAQCGVHVPAADAIQGSAGVYCSTAHRRLQES